MGIPPSRFLFSFHSKHSQINDEKIMKREVCVWESKKKKRKGLLVMIIVRNMFIILPWSAYRLAIRWPSVWPEFEWSFIPHRGVFIMIRVSWSRIPVFIFLFIFFVHFFRCMHFCVHFLCFIQFFASCCCYQPVIRTSKLGWENEGKGAKNVKG